MFCKYCGKELKDGVVVCQTCNKSNDENDLEENHLPPELDQYDYKRRKKVKYKKHSNEIGEAEYDSRYISFPRYIFSFLLLSLLLITFYSYEKGNVNNGMAQEIANVSSNHLVDSDKTDTDKADTDKADTATDKNNKSIADSDKKNNEINKSSSLEESSVSGYYQYTNSRYGYRILIPQSFHQIKDGDDCDAAFVDDMSGKIRVGSESTRSSRRQVEATVKEGLDHIIYEAHDDSWFVLSYRERGKDTYMKAFVLPNVIIWFTISFDAYDENYYKNFIDKMEPSFYPGRDL